MTTRHPLKSSGAWVELRDVEDLRARDRKAVSKIVMSAITFDLDSGEVTAGPDAATRIVDETPDAVAAQLITSWEIPYLPDARIPRLEPEMLDELLIEDYDRLRELVEPAVALLMPHGSNNVDDHADPQSPSEPASA